MKKLIIIKAGDTFPDIIQKHGGFDKWVADRLGTEAGRLQVVDVANGDRLPEPEDILGAVMTGSHSMVTDKLGWSEYTAEWIRRAVIAGVPFLGICYGHQLLAHAMGGEVDYHSGGREVGTVPVRLSENAASDALFKNMPREFQAHVTHSQTVAKLPEGAVLLGGNDFEKTHAFRVGSCAWGVQFHPEFSTDVMADYIHKQAPYFETAGISLDEVLRNVNSTAEAESVMRMFTEICFNTNILI